MSALLSRSPAPRTPSSSQIPICSPARSDHPAPALAAIGQEPEWESVPLTGALAGRGTGVLDMARSIRTGSRPLASGALGYHVLDTLMAMDESVASGRTVDITSAPSSWLGRPTRYP